MVRALFILCGAFLFAAPALATPTCPAGQFVTGENPFTCAAPTAGIGTVTSVTGTANQVSVASGTTTPVISLTGPYSSATYTAHALLVGEGTSGIAAVACADARVLLGQSGIDPACVALSGDCTIADTGVLTCSIPANHVTGLNAIATGGITGGGAVSHQFVSAISGTGAATLSQPAFTDISGTATNAQLPIVNVANGGTQCGAPTTVAGLPGSPTKGEICFVTDATTCTANSAVTGGGATNCQVTWNGTSWLPGGGVVSSAAGGVTSVGATAPITSSGGATPTIALTTPLTGNAVTLAGDTSGASNSNQTTVTHLAAPLPVAQGGTQCAAPSIFASLPGAPTKGEVCFVTDAPACTAGTAVTVGGGATQCQVTWDGTNWQPAGAAMSAAAGGVTSISTTAPIATTGGATPTLSLTEPLTGNAVTLAGDTSGASNSNQTTVTHLASALPVAQGGRQCGAPSTFAGLPGTPTNGEICNVTDANSCVTGTNITSGGGSTKCEVTYDGTNWRPAGGALSVITAINVTAPITTTGGATPTIAITTPLTGNAVTLAGDTSGASNANQTTVTHLASPLPVAQGGTQCTGPVVFASLPGAPTNGEICNVTDATACVAGTAVTAGGSSFKCQVTYNGTNWFPAGGATSPVGPQSSGFFFGGTPNATVVEAFACPATLTFAANFAVSGLTPASVISCGINPTGAPDTYTISIGGVTAGTLSISTSCAATFATTGGTSQNCTAGQRLAIFPTGSPTGGNVAISLVHNP